LQLLDKLDIVLERVYLSLMSLSLLNTRVTSRNLVRVTCFDMHFGLRSRSAAILLLNVLAISNLVTHVCFVHRRDALG